MNGWMQQAGANARKEDSSRHDAGENDGMRECRCESCSKAFRDRNDLKRMCPACDEAGMYKSVPYSCHCGGNGFAPRWKVEGNYEHCYECSLRRKK